MASGDRTPRLRSLNVPTTVIHGRDDPLVPFRGGRATAAAIPDARLIAIPGMGHDLPREVWPQLVDAVAETARRSAPGVAGLAYGRCCSTPGQGLSVSGSKTSSASWYRSAYSASTASRTSAHGRSTAPTVAGSQSSPSAA